MRLRRNKQDQETLRKFIQHFNGAALEVSTATPDILISAFTQGLKGGEFFKSLVKKPPSSYDDLLARAEKDKVMGVDEGRRRKESSQKVDEGPKFLPPMRRERTPPRGNQEFRSPSRKGRGPPWVNPRTEVPRGQMEGQVTPKGLDQKGRVDEANNPTRGMIHIISGDATDGDSGRARKVHGRRMENFEISKDLNLPQDPIISFGPKDLRGVVAPHNDALVVTVTIANYDVARIIVDIGVQ
ncbi:uncharacterized protein [Henckelia pumila]|uniref:uncharacterized protein n=1 Tax=Henckelia pumila TaxID=405737 RepID=UPI003C6E797D